MNEVSGGPSKKRGPSRARVNDWIEEGYRHESSNVTAACEVWWKAWCALLPHFRSEMDTMMAAQAVCPGTHLVFNWCQSLETALWNACLRDPKFIPIGERYCREWLAQFGAEMPQLQANFNGTLADFTFKLGNTEQARAILEKTLADWPDEPFGYVALADAYSHLFADRTCHLPFDLAMARQVLKRGLARLTKKTDRKALQERLKLLSEAIPVSQKPLPKKKSDSH